MCAHPPAPPRSSTALHSTPPHTCGRADVQSQPHLRESQAPSPEIRVSEKTKNCAMQRQHHHEEEPVTSSHAGQARTQATARPALPYRRTPPQPMTRQHGPTQKEGGRGALSATNSNFRSQVDGALPKAPGLPCIPKARALLPHTHSLPALASRPRPLSRPPPCH